MKTRKPPPLGNVWVTCEIQVMDLAATPPKWKTVRRGVVETPNAIAAAVAELRREHPGASFWVRGYCGDRTHVGK